MIDCVRCDGTGQFTECWACADTDRGWCIHGQNVCKLCAGTGKISRDLRHEWEHRPPLGNVDLPERDIEYRESRINPGLQVPDPKWHDYPSEIGQHRQWVCTDCGIVIGSPSARHQVSALDEDTVELDTPCPVCRANVWVPIDVDGGAVHMQASEVVDE